MSDSEISLAQDVRMYSLRTLLALASVFFYIRWVRRPGNVRALLWLGTLVALYHANAWSSAGKGAVLREAMRGSHAVVTAWAGDRLVGLGNTLSARLLPISRARLGGNLRGC